MNDKLEPIRSIRTAIKRDPLSPSGLVTKPLSNEIPYEAPVLVFAEKTAGIDRTDISGKAITVTKENQVISRKAYMEQAPAVLGEIAEMVVKGTHFKQEAMTILADARRALIRASRRHEALPAHLERIEINQSRGPRLEFTGHLLAETQFETRDGLKIRMEIWETRGGALIGATYTSHAGRPDEEADAVIVPHSEDEQAMRFAILEHFQWDQRARSMVAKKLDWSLRLDVE